jgi:hypothetical protein
MSNNWVPPVPPIPTTAQPPQKKSRWWLYGLLGCGGLILVVIVIVVAAGAYVWQKVPKTQGEIIAKIIETANPNVEIVNLDEAAGSVTIKDKKTGKITTISLDDAKAGNITFTSEDTGESVSLGAGAAARLPSWVTPYPGASAQGGITGQKEGGNSGSINYTTADSVAQVAEFYKQKMNDQGFVLQDESQMPSSETFAMVVGKSADENRTLTVAASSAEGQTTIQLTFEEKSE